MQAVDGSVPPSVCGDGVLDESEICDDGNTVSCDGCASDCQATESLQNFYPDADGDGYGDGASPVSAYCKPSGTVVNANDCNDGDASVSPAASEVCGGWR